MAFQPPEQPQKQLAIADIVGEQFRQLARLNPNEAPTYFSLLPPDIDTLLKHLIPLIASSSLEKTIADIRKSNYYKELQNRITDISVNPNYQDELKIKDEVQQLIDTLFQIYQSQGVDRFTIALLLNIRPSFEIAFSSAPPNRNWSALRDWEQVRELRLQYHDTQRIFSILKRYITINQLGYQALIEYVSSFLSNYRWFTNRYSEGTRPMTIGDLFGREEERNYDEDKFIVMIMDMFEDTFKQSSKQTSELKVLLDVHRYKLIKEFLCTSPKNLLKNPIVQRYLRKRNLSESTVNATAFQQRFTQSWVDVFLEYLNANKHEAKWMFNYERMFDCQNELLRRLLIEKAGITLILHGGLYLFDRFEQTFYIDLLDYLFQHDPQGTATLIHQEQIVKFIKEKLGADPSFSIAQERDRKTAIAFLVALIQSPRVDANFIKELLQVSITRKDSKPDFVVNFADNEGITLLMHAIKVAHFDIVNIFLDDPHITINECDRNGHNALSFAQLLPESHERDVLIKRLNDMGAQDEGVCAIQ
jgi:hypothetical protein